MSTDRARAVASQRTRTTAVENLDHHECWRLLRSVSVGRLAVWVDDHPDIFPINYKVDHGTLVFRTAEGTKLQAATGDTPVALEADGVDADSGVAWSVVIKGQAAPVQNPQEVMDTVGLLLFPWQAGKEGTLRPDYAGDRHRPALQGGPAADVVDAVGRRHPVRPRIAPATFWCPIRANTPAAGQPQLTA